MTQAVGSGKVTASVTGSVNETPQNIGTITFITASRSTAGTTTLGTVGANKAWKILYISMAGSGNGAENSNVQLNSVVAKTLHFSGGTGSGTTANTAASDSTYFDYSFAAVLTAGQTATLTTSSSSATVSAVVGYYEYSV